MVRRYGANEAEDESGGHDEALELDEEVDFPPAVVLQQRSRIQDASGHEEDEANAEVRCDGTFDLLVCEGDLDLAGYGDEDA